MPKGVPNKRYTPEFKKLVVETMQKEKLSYREAARQFEINDHKCVAAWERIYLMEDLEGFAVERRGRSRKGRPPKQLPKGVGKKHVTIEIYFTYVGTIRIPLKKPNVSADAETPA